MGLKQSGGWWSPRRAQWDGWHLSWLHDYSSMLQLQSGAEGSAGGLMSGHLMQQPRTMPALPWILDPVLRVGGPPAGERCHYCMPPRLHTIDNRSHSMAGPA